MDDDKHCEDGEIKKRTHFLEQTGLQRKKTDSLGLATSKWYHIKHIGYNDIQVFFCMYTNSPKSYLQFSTSAVQISKLKVYIDVLNKVRLPAPPCDPSEQHLGCERQTPLQHKCCKQERLSPFKD